MTYIQRYSDLLVHKPRTLRDHVRDIGLNMLTAGFGLRHSMDRLLATPRIQFLYIHHVFSDEEGQLDRLMQALQRDHSFLTYSSAVEKILRGEIDRPYIVISSDDGLKNNLRAAAILEKYGATACFFVCPSIVGECDFRRIQAFSAGRLHFPPVEFMDWEDIGDLLRRGHEIGAHTLSHINIARCPPDEVEKEIAGCREILLSRCGRSDHFAFPYGRFSDFSSLGRELVFANGFRSCASAQRGCHVSLPGQVIAPGDLLIRRDHVVLDWPLRQILYFIARNAARASAENNFFPSLCGS